MSESSHTDLPDDLPDANLWRRCLATLVDVLVLVPIAFFIMLATGLMETADAYVWPQPVIRLFGLLVFSYFAIHGYWLLRGGQTVGRKLVGLELVSAADGTRLPVWRIAARAFAIPFALLLALVSGFLIEIVALVLLIDPLVALAGQKRSLHDYLSGAVVHDQT